MRLHPLDPNTLGLDAPHEYRVYLDDREGLWVAVDEADWRWAIKYRWNPKHSRGGKIYARRAVGENANGMRLRTFTIYLHVEILRASGVVPPSPGHTLVDHRDGNSRNCLRTNLRWATPTMNARNLYGRHPRDLVEDHHALPPL